MKIFLAGSSKDRGWISLLVEQVRARGHEVHDWPSHAGYENPECIDPEKISEENLEAVAQSDGVIWLHTRNSSTGAPLEVGFAFGKRIPIRVIAVDHKPPRENVYLHFLTWSDGLGEALESIALEKAGVRHG